MDIYTCWYVYQLTGCMAENLKKKILEKEKSVDIICGPDAYRDLPHMLAATAETDQASGTFL